MSQGRLDGVTSIVSCLSTSEPLWERSKKSIGIGKAGNAGGGIMTKAGEHIVERLVGAHKAQRG